MRALLTGPSALLAVALLVSACGGGGGGGGTPVTASPSPTPTGSSNPAAFNCPSSATTFAVTQGRGAASTQGRRAHAPVRMMPATSDSLLAVTYRSGSATAQALDAHVRTVSGTTVKELAFDRIGRTTRVVAVNPASRDTVAASLRSVPGVIDVSPVQRRYTQKITAPGDITNDPFFRGFGPGAPLYESATSSGGGTNPSMGGQWDMHIEHLEYAFAYATNPNGSGVVNTNALGSHNVKVAIIDTGVDTTQPDISAADVVRTQCFITNTTGAQSTGTFVTDPDGHGTDVAGIAGAAVGDGNGFAGDGGNIALMLYRVFPVPDANCASPTTTDPQCGAADVDIASAINDAVNQGAKVINLSFGTSGSNNICTNGQDPDPTEGNAITNAILQNVIVVAASGNGGGSGVGAPACDTGVIAVGATGYNDGQTNATGYTGSNTEYVTSYTQYGAPNTLRNPTSWGIVAPGGDGASASDDDNLHWISNIWTSTPWDVNSDSGICGTSSFTSTNACYIFIDGTSMSTPHVAGAAALILSVNSATYGNPAAMKTLLCATADNIKDPHQGCGRLNVYTAMARALGDPSPPTPAP